MAGRDIDRRQFLEKSALVATAAAGIGLPRAAHGQINNAAGVNVKPVRLGFVGVGIRGTLLMEAAKGIFGAEIVAAADCYKGHLDRAKELISTGIQTTGDYRQVIARPTWTPCWWPRQTTGT
jgi:hypothetical protein